MKRLSVLILVATLTGLTGLPSTATAPLQDCVPTEAQQMISIATSHLDAYLHPETAPFVPLAEDARRTEFPPGLPREMGGPVQTTSGTEAHAYYVASPTVRFIRGYGDFRWILDIPNCEATVFFLLDYQLPGITLTIHLGERFRISAGLIEEIEVISWRANGQNGSCWPANGDPNQGRSGLCDQDLTTIPYGPTPGCVPGTREQTIATAQTYLTALASRDASAVPLAGDARRTEMPPPDGRGPVTGTSGAEIAGSLETDPRFDGIVAVRDVRWFVDAARCQATAFYLVDGELGNATRSGSRHHVTRFLVSGGQIREIEDIWHRPLDPTKYEGSCWPQTWDDAEDETYRALPCSVEP